MIFRSYLTLLNESGINLAFLLVRNDGSTVDLNLRTATEYDMHIHHFYNECEVIKRIHINRTGKTKSQSQTRKCTIRSESVE